MLQPTVDPSRPLCLNMSNANIYRLPVWNGTRHRDFLRQQVALMSSFGIRFP